METEKTVWLLGAGFSRRLGGPLFHDLISERTEHWVRAWVAAHASGPETQGLFAQCRLVYEKGVRVGLWSDAEQCIEVLDRARTDRVTQYVVQAGLQQSDPAKVFPGVQHPINLEQTFTLFTQFVAVATAHYVPESGDLPEPWHPFVAWGKLLKSPHDSIISFNYDRVVERLEIAVPLYKLHGTTPTSVDLIKCLDSRSAVETIFVPGPNKLKAHRGEVWEAAGRALREANRLVVIGYSFPASDAVAMSFVLGNFKGQELAIVLGEDPAGSKIYRMFRHMIDDTGRPVVVNTGLLTEAYFTEGTARAENGRFMHSATFPYLRP